ncbi:MAG TPA: hypothetical protein VJZ70_00265 [Limnochordia bacterium]|nr:hypothetical protein [Limnochordia bacterium]
MRKWILAFFLLLLAIIVAFSIFVWTGVIDGPALFRDVGMKIGWVEPHLKVYAIGQDTEAWVESQQAELELQLKELAQREAQLLADHQQLEQRAGQLDSREATINTQSTKLQEQEEQRRSVQTLAALYTEMDAVDVARILEKLDKKLILDVLLQMDMQDAAVILTELPTNLAVTLSEELVQASQ